MTEATAALKAPRPSFAALRHSGFRPYLIGNALVMMADSIEHVISYWVMYQKFHSPALGGFAVISHWVPFLVFGVWVGALSDRFDPRRIIQIGMVLFMLCSLSWAVLFYSGWLAEWHAVAILTVHGVAALFWNPASQVLINDIVGPDDLPSAVRLMATSRYLGLFAGPAVGGAILLALGPSYGLVVNSLIYLPLTLWLINAPYGPRYRKEKIAPARIRGLADLAATLRVVVGVRVLTAMTALGGAYALFIGNAYQAQMPGYARDYGHGDPGLLYSLLLGADASGAILAGIVLEGSGWLLPRAKTAFVLAMLWCCAIFGFALAPAYPAALVCLFVAGFLELSFNSMAMSLVQLNAPNEMRGRVIGFFSMSAIGLRAFSGATVGLGGSLLGAHRSLAGAALILLVVIAGLAWSMRARAPARAS